MNDLQIFKNEEFGEIRTITIKEEPYFVGKDVADILGYQNGSRDVNRHVDEDDRISDVMFFDGNQNRNMTIINESGLYSLILSSKLPTAKKFKKWVTSEVLPSIRKHGVYANEELLDNPDLLISVLQELKKEREEKQLLLLENSSKDKLIKELQPKAYYVDMILQNKSITPITPFAKDYGMTGQDMNKLLHNFGIQYKMGKQWLLYEKYQSYGYTHSKATKITRKDGRLDVSYNTEWTQKGRLFLYEFLKEKGIIPVIEREV